MLHTIEQIRRQGYAITRGLVPADLARTVLDRASLRLDELVEHNGSLAPQFYGDDFYEPVEYFRGVIEGFLGRWRHQHCDSVSIVQVNGPERTSGGIGWHTDGMYFDDLGTALTAWIALEPCGTDTPGLKMAKADRPTVERFLGFDPDAPAARLAGLPDNAHRYASGLCARLETAERFFQIENPTYEAGDVVFMTNWCLHATHRAPSMTRPRLSMQLRFIAEA